MTCTMEMIESGVVTPGRSHKNQKLRWFTDKMNEPPGARARVALSALTMAEYFRDEEGQDVLFFLDNIFRFTQAGSEVSALFRDVFHLLWVISQRYRQKWVRCKNALHPPTKVRSHLFQAVYVPADDLTDPAPATTFSHLDATTVLSRQIAETGDLPSG